jgi:hypothetical protein
VVVVVKGGMGPPDWDEIEGDYSKSTEAEKSSAARNMLIAAIVLFVVALILLPL